MQPPNHIERISGLLHEAADAQVSSSAEALWRFESLEKRMGIVEDIAVDLQSEVKTNTEITTSIAGNTAELLDLFKSVKGGFKVMGWLGRFAKWVAAILAAFAAIYAFVQNLKGH